MGRYDHGLEVPPNVSKFNLAAVPSNPAFKSSESKPAGGAVNSRLAMEAIRVRLGKHEEIRLLDANAPDPLIQSEVPQPIRYLGLRSCPWNYVFGSGGDKRIGRLPISQAALLQRHQYADIGWLCEADTILINGAKDRELVAAIAAERKVRDFDIVLTVTPSLPARFQCSTALPVANVVIVAWDELEHLIKGSPLTIEGAAIGAEKLRRLAPYADVHVTMGKRGVMSLAAGSAEPIHIELDPDSDAAREAEELVRQQPSRLAGAGDAFSGGVTARRAFGWSLLSGVGVFGSRVDGTFAGCASSLRWVGVTSDLEGAFGVRHVALAA